MIDYRDVLKNNSEEKLISAVKNGMDVALRRFSASRCIRLSRSEKTFPELIPDRMA
jgi:hypothetical protein